MKFCKKMAQFLIVSIILVIFHFTTFSIQKENRILKSKNTGKRIDLEQYTTDLINKLMPKDYNRNLRPNYGGHPVHVNISILINDISAISETAMNFKVDFYIRHYWNDHRLTFPVRHNLSTVTLGEDFVKQIWLPDSSFDNGKESTVHETVFAGSTTLFRLKFNGDITYSTKISLTAQCPMDLTFFPLDQQVCSILLSSYGHANTELIYHWSEDPRGVEIGSHIFLPSFRLLGFNQFEIEELFSTGTYSQVRCDIFFARSIGYYVSQVYIPALLIVVISWVPFWLDPHDHLAKVALGVTTVLTMTTLTTTSSSDFPKISYLKAIDIYLFICFLLVFLSLIEYAIVGYYQFEINPPRIEACKRCERKGIKIIATDKNDNEMTKLPPCEQTKRRLFEDTGIIDQAARWIFPCAFIAFNIVYIVCLCLLVLFNSKHLNIQTKL